MNALILVLFVTVSTAQYLAIEGWLPGMSKLVPDALSAVAVLLVILLGVQNRFRYVRPAYWLLFASMAIVMLFGAIANSLEPGPIVAGMRNYLRAIPFFLLPAVYLYSERQVGRQLSVLLAIALIQLPLALEQRLHALSRDNTSGDEAFGTLITTGYASVFAVCVACILTAMYLRNRLRAVPFFVLLLITLGPTAVNETKATFVLLPVGLIVVYLTTAAPGQRVRNLLASTMALIVAGAIIVPVYNYFGEMRQWGGGTAQDYFLDRERFVSYVFREGGESSGKPGRGTAMIVATKEISKDPVTFSFGKGIGNVSDSVLGPKFSGKYFDVYRDYLTSGATSFLLEIGALGTALAIAIGLAIYRDARRVAANDDSLIGALAAGWTGVAIVTLLGIAYIDNTASAALSYVFWFYSGLIAARRMALSAVMNSPDRATVES